MKLRHVAIIYETVMVILVILSLSTLFTSSSTFENLHTITWGIFLIDVIVRFIKASTKWSYVKKNPFDILSIIPWEDMFLLGRFARLLRLLRYKNVVKRYLDRINKLLDRLNFLKITIAVLVFNLAFALVFSLFTDFTIVKSLYFTFMNFFKFNHQSENTDYVFLSIGLKIIGVLYMGVLLNKLLNFGKKHFESYKARKKKDTENDQNGLENTP